MIENTFISAVLFYATPILIGGALWAVLGKGKRISFPFVLYFITGSLFLFAVALVESFVLRFFPSVAFSIVYRYSLYILLALSLPINAFNLVKTNMKDATKYFYPVFLSLLLALIITRVWAIHTPYPLNWDLYEHQILANEIVRGHLSFFTSRMSDAFTFNGYSSLFHTLVATAQILVPSDILSFWQSITFFHLFLTILASFTLAKILTDNETVATVSAVIGAFIFESNVVYTTLFFIPQTLTSLVFVFLISHLLEVWKRRERYFPVALILTCGFLLLMHYIIGFVAVVILLGVYLFLYHRSRIEEKMRIVLIVEFLFDLLFIFLIASYFIPLGFINKGEAQFYAFSLADKFKFMQNSYGYLLLFFPIGLYALYKIKSVFARIGIIVTLILFGLTISQFPYVLKFYVLGRYFVHVIVAFGLFVIVSRILNPLFRSLAYMVFLVTILGIFITNSAYFKSINLYEDTYVQVSPSEVKAAEYLKKTYGGSTALLISDPATQNVLEALSTINSAGGAYADAEIRGLLIDLTIATDSSEMRDGLTKISDRLDSSDRRLFVVGGRYFAWQNATVADKQAYFFNVWAPVDLSLADYRRIEKLKQTPSDFTFVYENPGLSIFEVKNKSTEVD
ncbi:hypothetical protein HYW55_03790 [Candidatus Gottesmanbacteria bacterium]|nr:hypothetical protein [Candidatus Gottesmanbacteria bacterium]